MPDPIPSDRWITPPEVCDYVIDQRGLPAEKLRHFKAPDIEEWVKKAKQPQSRSL